jgi:putative membrane protein
MNAARLFDQDGRTRITQAVRSAEATTIGQIVPVVVDRSDHYPEGPLRAALLTAALAAVVSSIAELDVTASLLIVGASALLGVGLTLILPPLQRALIGRTSLEAHVHHRALRAFVEHGVHHTRAETGVLVFASLFERRVVILGDRAIHEKMGEAGWRQAVSVLTLGLRRGTAEEGFIAAIEMIGKRLTESFPRNAEPPGNELSDELRLDRS